jgi:hypothetical protein
MLDMWTDVFASPGWRTTGTQTANFLVTPPGWRPDLRDRFIEEFRLPKDTRRIDAPTPYVWIIGRTKTDGPSDYDAVRKIQAGFKATPLSEWGKTPKPVEVKIDPSVDMKTPPKIQVDAMPAGTYFAYAAELLKVNPPHLTDEPIIAQMKRIGIEPGKSFDINKVDPVVRKALEGASAAAKNLEVRGTHRQVEPATGHASAGNSEPGSTISLNESADTAASALHPCATGRSIDELCLVSLTRHGKQLPARPGGADM